MIEEWLHVERIGRRQRKVKDVGGKEYERQGKAESQRKVMSYSIAKSTRCHKKGMGAISEELMPKQ